ncbi:hypothetical protein BGZ65_010166, partial [Modicella reniformis]
MACPAGFTFDSTPRKGPNAEMTETLQSGTRLFYHGYDIVWSENHLLASRLESLRRIGDELADNALQVLKIKPGEDAYTILQAYVAQPEHEQESPAPRMLMKQLMAVPEWVDWEQVRRGQQVFWRYYFFISHALLHFSLAGGFSAPKISKVLTSTGYLSGSRTKERVYETSQFVLDIANSLEHLQPGSGAGWKSTIQDLLGTLFSFSNCVWRVMETKMGVHMTRQEREDYLHLWRYVGYLMGVDDIFGATKSPELADACLESIILHSVEPDPESGKLCASLLKSMAATPKLMTKVIRTLGLPDPFKFHLVLAESLLGADFWKANGLPSMSKPYWLLQKLMIWLMMVDLRLVNMLPWWFRARSLMIQKTYYMMVAKNLGKKRTQFELRELPKTLPDIQLASKSLDDLTP